MRRLSHLRIFDLSDYGGKIIEFIEKYLKFILPSVEPIAKFQGLVPIRHRLDVCSISVDFRGIAQLMEVIGTIS